MRNNITLGRLAGVSVEVNWTVLIIAAIVTFSVAGGFLPATAPGYAPGIYLAAGMLTAGALLISVLLHELGHAVVARRHGVRVERISLWAFGGVAQLEGEVPDPAAEFRIAGIGPAISLVLGLALLGVSTATAGLVGAVVVWVGAINVALAVFNLIPGAPLDGGRLLHAWLWKRHGDRNRATNTAGRAGRIVGAGLIGLGVFQFLTGNAGGLWTAFIGWFLRAAATSEGRHASLQRDLQGIRIREVMTATTPVMGMWLSVAAFIERHVVDDYQTFYLAAGEDGLPAGLVTAGALAAVPVEERAATSVRTIAEPVVDLPAVHAETPASDLMQAIGSAPVAVVWEGPIPIGVVTPEHLIEAAADSRLLADLRGERRPAA
jgi:Zn-dependent protease